MQILTVYNVGQGDSFLLSPENCVLKDIPLLIDCGPEKEKIANKIEKKVCLMLTHSHTDHIGGFPLLYRQKKLRGLLIPYYMPEVMQIQKFLSAFLKKRIIGSIDWRKLKKVPFRLVSEGDSLCNHSKILNPPKNPAEHFVYFSARQQEIQDSLNYLNELGFELPREDIINYSSPLPLDDAEYRESSKKYVHLFFNSLASRIRSNNASATQYYTTSHLTLTANQASIVLKFSMNNESYLFTGDADEHVFNRLIKNGANIQSKYLKIPHHGSRENMSCYILSHIDPEVAIISHGNRKFGRSKDPHPHYEIIDLLDRDRINSHYTNNVIKDGISIKSKSLGLVDNILFK
jgi:beta-lactamase superfamily II metal-dependent hydrolase